MNGIGGCPNVGGICIGCTMPGFPDKFMPFMDEPPGSEAVVGRGRRSTARRSRALRRIHRQHDRRRAEAGGNGRGRQSHDRLRAELVTHDMMPRRNQQHRRDELGSDHADRRQPRHLHQDRLRQTRGRRVPQHVIDLPRLQHLHEGQGSARRAFHHEPDLRHLRRQPRHVLVLCAEHGLRRQAAAPRPSGSSISARRPSTCSTTTSSRTTWSASTSASGWCKETNPGVWAKAEKTEAPHAADHGYRTIGDIMRALNPFEGEFYREALQMSRDDARDVLPDGGPPRPSVDALPGRRGHGGDDPAVHGLSGPADALRRVHEARSCRCTTICSTSSTRRCPATRRSASAACCSAAGARSRTRTSAISTIAT